MNKYGFGIRSLTLTETQLQNMDRIEMSPIAREVLANSDVPWAHDLIGPDLDKALQVARHLIRQSFTIKKD